MDPATLAGLILLFGIIIGIVLSVPIAVVIGAVSFIAAVPLLGMQEAVLVTSQRMFTGINSFPLLAIPLFVLAGVIMNNGGIAGRLVDAAKVVTGRMPASLAQTNVVANAMFGAVSGAAVAAAAAVGTVMNPRMSAEGYKKPFSAAVNVASAPSGMLIPPSNTFIVYSLVSSTSIAALFMAGVFPGILWALACMVIVYLYARRQKGKLKSTDRVTFAQAMLVFWRAVPSMLMIIVVVGGIIFGYFTATESASIAVVYCLVLSAIYRSIKFRELPGILIDAGRTTAIVMLLVAVSTALSFVMSFARIPDVISDTILGATDSKVVVLLIMMVILLIVGTFMDPTPAILIFVPIFLPIALELGVDPVHFGAMVVMNLSVGVITPPVGNVLFVGARVARLRIEPVIKQLWPFLLAIIAMLFLVVFVPQLSLWLPTSTGLLIP
ncbi:MULTISPECIES: TRAP transporter large permease [unclassified Pseudactinotalea]|uniref:TRAP transporter large permease n=1 Tax=unclassified Pseudactinotalea TaxID=2649176 RepID=UPI00128B3BD7|nr:MULTISPECIES: TRAP transporter large permease [unclassified Pseudactinotalea]MPV50017.1 TRAP transporter large permease subunit [Pseudactinotalea sp. HY160]QGH69502.1 TRAP transporter large permease subunit [Pseudactinotalea sp. HY158]